MARAMLDKTHVHLKVFSNFQYIALAIDFAHLALNSLALISHFQYNFLISRWSKKVTSWISSSARIYHYLLPKVSKRIESTTLAKRSNDCVLSLHAAQRGHWNLRITFFSIIYKTKSKTFKNFLFMTFEKMLFTKSEKDNFEELKYSTGKLTKRF